MFDVFPIFFIYFAVFVLLVCLVVYSLVLFIKLANRGIEALDIYINEKNNKKGE